MLPEKLIGQLWAIHICGVEVWPIATLTRLGWFATPFLSYGDVFFFLNIHIHICILLYVYTKLHKYIWILSRSKLGLAMYVHTHCRLVTHNYLLHICSPYIYIYMYTVYIYIHEHIYKYAQLYTCI